MILATLTLLPIERQWNPFRSEKYKILRARRFWFDASENLSASRMCRLPGGIGFKCSVDEARRYSAGRRRRTSV
jgi:hypothetical protein